MNDISIRAMKEEDWPAVAAIYEQGIAGHRATFSLKVPTYAQWDGAHHKHSRLVAQNKNGVVIGWAVIAPSFARDVYSGVAEVSIYVHEDYQHQGVGQLLLEAMAEESERNGIWTLEALIFDDNLPSLALFQKCGYVELGVRQKLGYDTALQRWRNVALVERRSQSEKFM